MPGRDARSKKQHSTNNGRIQAGRQQTAETEAETKTEAYPAKASLHVNPFSTAKNDPTLIPSTLSPKMCVSNGSRVKPMHRANFIIKNKRHAGWRMHPATIKPLTGGARVRVRYQATFVSVIYTKSFLGMLPLVMTIVRKRRVELDSLTESSLTATLAEPSLTASLTESSLTASLTEPSLTAWRSGA